jgi:hypothetical protein
LLAASATSFISGTATLKFFANVPKLRIGFTATSGIAVFILCWFFPLFPETGTIQLDPRNRPWIFIKPVRLSARYDADLYSIDSDYQLVVSGRTAAIAAGVDDICGLSDEVDPSKLTASPLKSDPDPRKHMPLPSPILPDTVINLGCTINIHRKPHEPWPPIVKGYSVQGLVKYKDIDGNEHHTQFCLRDLDFWDGGFHNAPGRQGVKIYSDIWFIECSGDLTITSLFSRSPVVFHRTGATQVNFAYNLKFL